MTSSRSAAASGTATTASPLHNPEFRLLEWYTAAADYLDSIAVTEGLFSHLLERRAPVPAAERLAPPFLRMTMEEAFQRFAGIDLAACLDDPADAGAGGARGSP